MEIYRVSFLGNPGLCGDLSDHYPRGSSEAKNQGFVWLLRSIFVLAGLVLVVAVGWIYSKYRSSKKVNNGIDKSKCTLTSFHRLDFNEHEILDCLDEDNVIGSGASGKTYRAVLSNGKVVAMKKLCGGAQNNGFETEVEILGKIRHKNIVKLWCCYTTQNCKLLVSHPNSTLFRMV
ncbi:hypothetical protein NE237_002145 [Protea cynaroides]|uniref:Protein kinase domain-containing protein n=1 Tax=Protea cynaroides TaxID=273540 RepID=A0A9Q0QZ48_9MAGN|nr:hypothetical protein NE237_002145 [Protea cynaroides]